MQPSPRVEHASQPEPTVLLWLGVAAFMLGLVLSGVLFFATELAAISAFALSIALNGYYLVRRTHRRSLSGCFVAASIGILSLILAVLVVT